MNGGVHAEMEGQLTFSITCQIVEIKEDRICVRDDLGYLRWVRVGDSLKLTHTVTITKGQAHVEAAS